MLMRKKNASNRRLGFEQEIAEGGECTCIFPEGSEKLHLDNSSGCFCRLCHGAGSSAPITPGWGTPWSSLWIWCVTGLHPWGQESDTSVILTCPMDIQLSRREMLVVADQLSTQHLTLRSQYLTEPTLTFKTHHFFFK